MKGITGLAFVFLVVMLSCRMAVADSNKDVPHIVSTLPQQNELKAPVSTSISVTFDVDMDEASIVDSTFVVYARSTGLHYGNIGYNGLTKTATLNPINDFDVGEIVTVSLTSDITSSQGTPIDNSYTWSFTATVDGGDGTFIPDSNYPTGNAPNSIFAADLDSDGDLDLATANSTSNSISILKNDGESVFLLDSTYPVGTYPQSVVVADFDRDCDLDLATANGWSNDVSVLLNNGDGIFTTDSSYLVGDFPLSIFAADLDGDGDIDLATANTNTNNVSVLLNNGNGVFGSHSTYPVGDEPYSVYASDFDNDGDLDLATANDVSRNVAVLMNNGDGTFASPTFWQLDDKPVSIYAADLDGDGDVDLATANDMSNNVSVLLNNSDGTFAPYSAYDVGDQPISIFAADFDDDGDIDLSTINHMSDNISVLLNYGDGTFAPQSFHRTGDGPQTVFAADLDGDGDLDLATANWSSQNVSVLLNEVVCFDTDGDGFGDPLHPENQCPDDNCPYIYNPDQENADNDGAGDSCDICPFHADDDCCNPIGSNSPPEITSTSSIVITPGETLVYVATYFDPDCDGTELTFNYLTYPSWCTINGDTITGKIECDYADTLFRMVTSDGDISDMLQVSLIIDKSNQPPVITDTMTRVIIRSQKPFAYYPGIDDPDDSTHTILYPESPHWCTIRNDSVIGFTPDTLDSEPLTVIVGDYCHQDSLSFTVTVYICGDVDGNSSVDIDDMVFLVNYIFIGGPAPDPPESGDENCSGSVDIDDITYLINYIFLLGPAPCADCP